MNVYEYKIKSSVEAFKTLPKTKYLGTRTKKNTEFKLLQAFRNKKAQVRNYGGKLFTE